jgi:ribosomal protein S18 acetylase RimI-like enzyme
MSNRTFEIRRMSACSFEDAVQVWNEGFKGYFVDMTLTLDAFIGRLRREAISPELSFIVFSGGKPAGFLLNAIRLSDGKKIAWNGGTGVAPEFRGQGAGNLLVQAATNLYLAEHVDIATLEAIRHNTHAISLYKKFRYREIDRLVVLRHEGEIKRSRGRCEWSMKVVPAAVIGNLSFYAHSVPWQAQWQSVSLDGGEGLIICDDANNRLGYALFKRSYDENARLLSVTLYQCVAAPGVEDENVVRCLLEDVYTPFDLVCRRTTHNLSTRNELVRRVLKNWGFEVFIEQVHMARSLI